MTGMKGKLGSHFPVTEDKKFRLILCPNSLLFRVKCELKKCENPTQNLQIRREF